MTTPLNNEMSDLFTHVFQACITEINEFANESLAKNLTAKLAELQGTITKAPSDFLQSLLAKLMEFIANYKAQIMAVIGKVVLLAPAEAPALAAPAPPSGTVEQVSSSAVVTPVEPDPKKPLLDRVIKKEDTFNTKLDKLLHASLFNLPGVKQAHNAKNIKIDVKTDPGFHQQLQQHIQSAVTQTLKKELAGGAPPAAGSA